MASIEHIDLSNNRENDADIGQTTIVSQEHKLRMKKVIKEIVINTIVLLIFTGYGYYANIKLALEYYKQDQYLYVYLTLGFLIVPSVLVNYCYIIYVYVSGVGRSKICSNNLILGIPVLAPMILRCLTIYHGSHFLRYYKDTNRRVDQSVKTHYDKVHSLKFLLCNLGAIETAMNNYPQLVLQIYIYLTQSLLQRGALRLMQLGSIAASCGKISLAQTSWYDFIHGGPTKLWITLFISPLWRICQILPFVFALAAYLEVVGVIAFAVIIIATIAKFGGIVYGNYIIDLYEQEQFSWLIVASVMALSTVDCYCLRFTYTRFLLHFVRDYIFNIIMIWTWYYNTTNDSEWFYHPIAWGVTSVAFLTIPFAWLHHKYSDSVSKIEKFDELDCSEEHSDNYVVEKMQNLWKWCKKRNKSRDTCVLIEHEKKLDDERTTLIG